MCGDKIKHFQIKSTCLTLNRYSSTLITERSVIEMPKKAFLITEHLDNRTKYLNNRTNCSVIEVKSNYLDNRTVCSVIEVFCSVIEVLGCSVIEVNPNLFGYQGIRTFGYQGIRTFGYQGNLFGYRIFGY